MQDPDHSGKINTAALELVSTKGKDFHARLDFHIPLLPPGISIHTNT